MGNQLQTPGVEIILKTEIDPFFGTHSIIQRRIENHTEYLLRQEYIAQSSSVIEEINHRISKIRPFSNLITVKEIAKKDNQPACSSSIPVYLYYDYYRQTLRSEIRRRRQTNQSFSQQQIWFIINEISRGLAKLNQMGISHWDIRPQTIFKDQNDNLYILDSSYFIQPLRTRYFLQEKIRTSMGNLSPQVIQLIKKGSNKYRLEDLGPSNDMFAFGMTILQIAHLRDTNYYVSSFGVSTSKVEQDLFSLRSKHKNIANFLRKLLAQQFKRSGIEDVRNQLRPQQSEILRTASLIESDRQSKYSVQTPVQNRIIHHRINTYQSPPRKPEFKSAQKLSLTGIKKKHLNDGSSGLKSKPQSTRQYVLYSPRSPRVASSKFQF